METELEWVYSTFLRAKIEADALENSEEAARALMNLSVEYLNPSGGDVVLSTSSVQQQQQHSGSPPSIMDDVETTEGRSSSMEVIEASLVSNRSSYCPNRDEGQRRLLEGNDDDYLGSPLGLLLWLISIISAHLCGITPRNIHNWASSRSSACKCGWRSLVRNVTNI